MFQGDSTPPIIVASQTGRLFVFGDIHGCLSELDVLLSYLKNELSITQEDQLIFLGDYIDRGPNSAGVIDALIDLKAHFPKTIFLRGNHEQFLQAASGLSGTVSDKAQIAWLKSGGKETILSYGSDLTVASNLKAMLPESHQQFLLSLGRYVIGPDYVCVHAGLDPLKNLLTQPDDVIYWIREPFLHFPHLFEKTVIYGHTPEKSIKYEPPFRLGIDTGIVYGNKLTMIEFTQKLVFQVAASSKSVISSSF
jgi:serine/threonine protein phosphatase 1